ncbi:hypothetical protein OVY01_18805 [Robbsia sp. Bb-Pol-6]|uniref:Uncharacterized protein n=1 Tax=Robbsia betulipollinis TaxID=2981849 RepID=A0ABT3ZRM1_9BURK|nr:hypothetical protein [Robbsia betulipollinis]MCY0389200.1 hypothetical protein [Robbsia betulipollinis]
MNLLDNLSNMTLSRTDLILLLPMALVGVVLMGGVPCRTRIAHYVLEGVGAVVGALVAIVMMGSLSRML